MINRLLTIIFSVFILIGAAMAEEVKNPAKVPKNNKIIPVDVIVGKIGDVNYRATIGEIQKSIGSKRIKKSIEYPEGHPTDVHIININGHAIYKHWNATSFTDPVFKMKNGLGVGAKIKDFRKQYGNGEIRGGEGTSLCFESKSPEYYFCIPVLYENDLKLNDEKVNEIWVW